MRRLLNAAPSLVLGAALILSTGCASTITDGERFFLDGDLVQAESAIRDYLTSGHAKGNKKARNRYLLGLIYTLPEGPFYDWEEALHAFETLLADDPDSPWAQLGRVQIELDRESQRLERELAGQQERVDFLLGEVATLQGEADRAEDEVEDREQRMQRLNDEIGRLQQNMERIRTDLAARQEELERIKKIDLETPP